MYEQYIVRDREKLQQIKEGLLSTYFTNYDKAFLLSSAGCDDISANVYGRYNHALKFVVPWVSSHIELKNKTLAEVGCGTGASTAAFAHFVDNIVGYDIDTQAVAGAQIRLDVMGFDNVQLNVIDPKELVSSLRRDCVAGVDIILLFAVLEHQTIEERHETIKLCWELLNPEGLLVVTETPNLLHYTDLHTSQLPFLHLLPSLLYARYSDRSPRQGFAGNFSQADVPLSELETSIMRWGRGVSYHDFELALGRDYGRYLVADGFEPEMLSWFEVSFEEELLRRYFTFKELDVPVAFTRVVLNVIFKKSNSVDKIKNRIPKNKHVADMQTVIEQNIYIDTLMEKMETTETYLQEILSSKRWKIINYIAALYRRINFFLLK